MRECTDGTRSGGGSLGDQVHSTYVEARGRALGLSDRALMRKAKRLKRRRGQLDQPGLARLKAMLDVAKDRRLTC